MSYVRKLTAPVSVALLLIVAALAPFLIPPSSSVSVPPILDPNFGLWVGSSTQRHLVVWHAEYTVAPGDSITMGPISIAQMSALGFNLRKENANGSTYLFLSQSIEGPALGALFALNISAWVFTKTCECNATSLMLNGEIFGIEINDGTHVITFAFSEYASQTLVSWDQRIVFVKTLPNQWVNAPLDISREYSLAHWSRPNQVTFGVIFGEASGVGSRQEFLHNLTWVTPPPPSSKTAMTYETSQSSILIQNFITIATLESSFGIIGKGLTEVCGVRVLGTSIAETCD